VLQKVDFLYIEQQLTENQEIIFTTCFHHMSGAKNRTFKYDAVFSLPTHFHSQSELDFCLIPPPGQLPSSY
jgi:hypothetical protein